MRRLQRQSGNNQINKILTNLNDVRMPKKNAERKRQLDKSKFDKTELRGNEQEEKERQGKDMPNNKLSWEVLVVEDLEVEDLEVEVLVVEDLEAGMEPFRVQLAEHALIGLIIHDVVVEDIGDLKLLKWS